MPAPSKTNTTAVVSKADLEAQNASLAKRMENMRKQMANAEAVASEHASMVMYEGLTLGSAALAGWASGYYGEDWAILGMDPSLVVGIPTLIGGVALSFMGYPTLGEASLAFGRGLVLESVVRRSINYGADKAKDKGASGSGASGSSGAAAELPDTNGDGKPGAEPHRGGRPVYVSPRAARVATY